jgi:hypothetical protein
MPRVSTRVVAGETIVFQDFRNLASAADAAAAFDESRSVISRSPPNSALVLTDFSGARFNTEMVEAAKRLAADNRPYIRASALVGISGIQSVLFTGVNRAAERDIKWFESVEEAERWLLSAGEEQPGSAATPPAS